MRRIRTPAMFVALVVCFIPFAVATEYYVDVQNGDDGNTGSDWEDAYATIGKAISSCSGSWADVVHVAEGIYNESIDFKSFVTLLGGYPAGGGVRSPENSLTAIDGAAIMRLPRPVYQGSQPKSNVRTKKMLIWFCFMKDFILLFPSALSLGRPFLARALSLNTRRHLLPCS